MNNRWTYTIDGVQIHPLNTRSYELKWELEDQFIYDYRLGFNGTVVLNGTDYDYLRTLELSKRFAKITFKIFDTGIEVYNGLFLMSDCEFDPYKFTATLKTTAYDQYSAIQEVEDIEVDVVEGGIQSITADIYSYWYFFCTRMPRGQDPNDPLVLNINAHSDPNYAIDVFLRVTELVKVDKYAAVPTGFNSTPFATLDKYIIYQRYPVNFNINYVLDYIGPTDLSDYKWSPLPFYKLPYDESIHNLIKLNFSIGDSNVDYSLLWIKKSAYNFRANSVVNQAYRGMELSAVMNRVIHTALPSFTGNVVSSFLFADEGPTGRVDPLTEYTDLGFTSGQYGKYLIEMSDFRRPNAYEPATVGILTWKDISEYLCQKYANELRWFIDSDGNIRFEHYTYFTTEQGMDLTSNPHITQKYRYIDAGKPNRIIYSESSAWNEDFKDIEVLFGTVPAVSGQKEDKQTLSMSKIFTDIDGLNQHSDELSDDGFVYVEVYKTTEPGVTNVKYGFHYNWFAVSDARVLAPLGWHPQTYAEILEIADTISDVNTCSHEMKEAGFEHWEVTNAGTNTSGFTSRGNGVRNDEGVFSALLNQSFNWLIDSWEPTMGCMYSMLPDTDALGFSVGDNIGAGLRWVKDDSTDPGSVTGNDGKVYPTVKIGNIVITSCNVAETKYRNGDPISYVTDDENWASLSTGARCAYDNDLANVTEGETTPSHDKWSVVKGTGFKSTDTDLQNAPLSIANCLNDYGRYRALQDVYKIGGRDVIAISLQRMKYQQIEFAERSMPDIEKEIVTKTGNGLIKSIKFAPTVEHKYIAELLYD
jgi:uncharacterized protein (TIGR02145 family)